MLLERKEHGRVFREGPLHEVGPGGQRMATGKARCTRKLRNWIVEQVESGQFPGVCWDDAAKTMFRIPWKHAGKQDFREDQDAAIFKAWALFKEKHKDGDIGNPAVWKTRLRCALNKSSEFEEVPERGRMDVAEPYKVYRILPAGTLPTQPRNQKSPFKRSISSVSPERGECKELAQLKPPFKRTQCSWRIRFLRTQTTRCCSPSSMAGAWCMRSRCTA
ncbi:interferon regulatory factor 9 isoform X3 [Rattus norvegicus]|uniref:interferon regulatory factor 9 isoform X3 n=1 Tax=Rattus norvegicus TaxID=10116 RepID=UPI002FD7B70D